MYMAKETGIQLNKQTAQTLAELFPSLKTKGIPSRYSAVDQIGFRFDPDPSGGDFWRLAACLPDKAPYLLGQGDLKSPFGQAIVEKTLELIARREEWALNTFQRFPESPQDPYCATVQTAQGPSEKNYNVGYGETKLDAMTSAMIAARQGG
jgi:hypothetical protein